VVWNDSQSRHFMWWYKVISIVNKDLSADSLKRIGSCGGDHHAWLFHSRKVEGLRTYVSAATLIDKGRRHCWPERRYQRQSNWTAPRITRNLRIINYEIEKTDI